MKKITITLLFACLLFDGCMKYTVEDRVTAYYTGEKDNICAFVHLWNYYSIQMHGAEFDLDSCTYSNGTLTIGQNACMRYSMHCIENGATGMMVTLNSKVLVPYQEAPISGSYNFDNDAPGTYQLKISFNDGISKTIVLIIDDTAEK